MTDIGFGFQMQSGSYYDHIASQLLTSYLQHPLFFVLVTTSLTWIYLLLTLALFCRWPSLAPFSQEHLPYHYQVDWNFLQPGRVFTTLIFFFSFSPSPLCQGPNNFPAILKHQ
jgi:hypothetical protein